MDAQTVVKAIQLGELDWFLPMLRDEIDDRQTRLHNQEAAEKLSTFLPGEAVMFNDVVRPKYLRGVRGKVKRISGNKVVIDIEKNPKAERFSGSVDVKCYPTTLDRVP